MTELTAHFKSDRVYRNGEKIIIGNSYYIVFERMNIEVRDIDDYCSLTAIIYKVQDTSLAKYKVPRVKITEEDLIRAQNITARNAIAQITGNADDGVGFG